MKLQYKIDDGQISDMLLTIEITMTVDAWRKIMRTKNEAAHYEPFGKLQTQISQALGDITRATEKSYEYK
jgi:hypothetical protein